MPNGRDPHRGGGQGRGQTPRPAPVRIEFWKNRDARLVDPRLYSVTAEELAASIKHDNEASRGRNNKPSQLRKFYDEVVRLNELAKKHREESDKWDRIIFPTLHMLVAKAAYAQGRDLVSEGFRDFIKQGVSQVETPEDLGVFTSVFEAFLGFYKGMGAKG